MQADRGTLLVQGYLEGSLLNKCKLGFTLIFKNLGS